jgi:hypothetical protein
MSNETNTDESQALSEQLEASQKRLEITVPKPLVKLNLGTPAPATEEEEPFGFPGATLAAKDNVVLMAESAWAAQGRKTGAVLVGKEFSQYVGGDSIFVAQRSTTMGAKTSVLVAGGVAGNHPQLLPPHDTEVDIQTFNSLALHYRIDSLQANLFEFLHGRRDHEPSKFNHGKNTGALSPVNLEGGYAKNAHRSLSELYPALVSKDPHFPPTLANRVAPPKPPFEDPVHWINPLFAEDSWDDQPEAAPPHVLFGGPTDADLQYGFGEVLAAWDPYRMWNPAGFADSRLRMLLNLLNLSVKLRRILDVATIFLFDPKSLFGKVDKVVTAIAGVSAALSGMPEQVMDLIDNPPPWLNDPSLLDPFAPPPQTRFADPNAQRQAPPAKKPFELPKVEDPARQAQVTSGAFLFDLSRQPTWTMDIATDRGTHTITIDLGAQPAKPARLIVRTQVPSAAPGPTFLAFEVDGQRYEATFTPADLATSEAIARRLRDALGTAVTVTTEGETLFLTTARVGPTAEIVVLEAVDPANAFLFDAGAQAHGAPAIAAVADPTRVTVAEIAARIPPDDDYQVVRTPHGLRIQSPTFGHGSRVELSGELVDLVYGGPRGDVVIQALADDPDKPQDFWQVLGSLNYYIQWVASLPEALRTFVGPYIDKVEKLVQTLEKRAAMYVKKLKRGGAAGKAQARRLAYPPESVGLFGAQGITLGTQDRIVGLGGNGVLFVVDGDSGSPDNERFVKAEKVLAGSVVKMPVRAERRPSLGFRVLSDTVVDLEASQSAQLFAMGRGKAVAARPDGKTEVGIGIARMLGSRASEVAAYEKVVISARSAGSATDTDAKTGGRVELAGQTIAIGAMNFDAKDAQGTEFGPNDFDAKSEHHHFGIAPYDLEQIAGLEHLQVTTGPKPKGLARARAVLARLQGAPAPNYKVITPGGDHLRMDMYCWPEKLRTDHPRTERVLVHAAKESLLLAGSYMVRASGDVGLHLGRRTASPDAFSNVLDAKSPSVKVLEDTLFLNVPNDAKEGSKLALTKDGGTLTAGEAGQGGAVDVKDGTVELAGGNTKVTVDKSKGLEVDAPEVNVQSNGNVKIKGSIVYIN